MFSTFARADAVQKGKVSGGCCERVENSALRLSPRVMKANAEKCDNFCFVNINMEKQVERVGGPRVGGGTKLVYYDFRLIAEK